MNQVDDVPNNIIPFHLSEYIIQSGLSRVEQRRLTQVPYDPGLWGYRAKKYLPVASIVHYNSSFTAWTRGPESHDAIGIANARLLSLNGKALRLGASMDAVESERPDFIFLFDKAIVLECTLLNGAYYIVPQIAPFGIPNPRNVMRYIETLSRDSPKSANQLIEENLVPLFKEDIVRLRDVLLESTIFSPTTPVLISPLPVLLTQLLQLHEKGEIQLQSYYIEAHYFLTCKVNPVDIIAILKSQIDLYRNLEKN